MRKKEKHRYDDKFLLGMTWGLVIGEYDNPKYHDSMFYKIIFGLAILYLLFVGGLFLYLWWTGRKDKKAG